MDKEINTVAIVGAGIMGSDVALDMAMNKIPVILKDLSPGVLEQSKTKIKSGFRMAKMMKKSMVVDQIDKVLDLIEFSTTWDRFGEADLVVENVTESLDVKSLVYSELKGVCREDAILAVNTSCISITKIGSLVNNPSRVIGVHFMNPVPLKPMVETIRGYHTSKETEDSLVNFLKSVGKSPVVVNDLPGFVANRISHLFMNEAAFVVQDKVAEPAQVDQIFKLGYGHSMGPLETADLIGLDTVLNSLDVLYNSYKDPKFRPCPLLQKMVDAGLLGRKSGQGFYKY